MQPKSRFYYDHLNAIFGKGNIHAKLEYVVELLAPRLQREGVKIPSYFDGWQAQAGEGPRKKKEQ